MVKLFENRLKALLLNPTTTMTLATFSRLINPYELKARYHKNNKANKIRKSKRSLIALFLGKFFKFVLDDIMNGIVAVIPLSSFKTAEFKIVGVDTNINILLERYKKIIEEVPIDIKIKNNFKFYIPIMILKSKRQNILKYYLIEIPKKTLKEIQEKAANDRSLYEVITSIEFTNVSQS